MTESATDIKLFAKWALEDIEITDISLVDFIAVRGILSLTLLISIIIYY